MLLEIDHHSGIPIYRQIMDQIRRQILTGQLSESEQLMSVRELAEQLKVNPMTISKAYTMLELEGFLERQRGIGLFIAKLRKAQKGQTKIKLLEQMLTKAVATAIQLEIPEQKTHQIITRLYQKHGLPLSSHSND